MKILLVNKFLYAKGGAETFAIKLGNYLENKGHDVQYFGMYDEKNSLKNKYNIYVSSKDFSKRSIKNYVKVFSLIYSFEAKNKMLKILKYFNPDLVILNNIEYHLTPSIIVAISKYKNINKNVKLFYVAHDYQMVCPSHGLFDNNMNMCEKCLNGSYFNCFKNKCLKNSRLKSLIGTLDSIYWHSRSIYKNVDIIICPSKFMQEKLNTKKEFKNKTFVIHNFVDKVESDNYAKKDYVIYFGKLCKDKGVETLLKVVKNLSDIQFVFAGYGPLENEVSKFDNVKFVGFKTGNELTKLISEAKLSIYPSEWYENCPFSVIESQMYGTPVIGSNIGGIPELIEVGKTGELFESKNDSDLQRVILDLWNNKTKLDEYSTNCKNISVETLESYVKKMFELFERC